MTQPEGGAGQRRLDELTALYRIATLGAFDGDTGVVVKGMMSVVAELIECERPLVFLYNENLDEMNLHQLGVEQARALRPSQCGLVRRAFINRAGEFSNDVTIDPEGQLAELLQARQIVAAPLAVDEEPLGVLAAVNSKRGAFNQSDLRLLSILADRASLTLQNSKLLATLRRQVEELEGLQRLSRLVTTSESLEFLISESLRIVTESVGCDKAAVLLYDEETDCLVAREPVYGLDREQIAGLQISMDQPSLVGTVFRTGTPLTSNDAERDGWVGASLRKLLDMKTLVAVPLTTGPRPIGVLNVMNAHRGFFTEEDERFLALLGGQIGSAIEALRARDRERELMGELKELDRTRTEFISILAHELRGPMTTLMGFGYALRDQSDKLDEEKRMHIIATVVREIERLSRMVTDLLDVSRMEAGAITYEPEPVDLKTFVEALVKVHSSLRAQHFVDPQIPADLPKAIADPDRLGQIFLNLLTNATRYSAEGTTITVEGRGDETEVVVAVRDEGIGIRPEDHERVFEKFSMLPKPTWTKKGTGLGLFITKGILDAMGGRIWLESEPGKGTTFFFTLPRADGV